MDGSLKSLVSDSKSEAVSLKNEKGDVLYSFSKGEGKSPFLVNFFFSNQATRAVRHLNQLSEPGTEQQKKTWIDSDLQLDWPRIQLRTAIWIDSHFVLKESFNEVIQKTVKPEVFKRDFRDKEALKTEVNTWIERKTGGLIEDAVESEDIASDTLGRINRILVSTLDFVGEWSVPLTSDGSLYDFKAICSSPIKVPFMTSTEEEHYVQQFNGFKLLALPYKNIDFSMLFYLPDEEYGEMNLEDFIHHYESVIQYVYRPRRQKVSKLLIPKFELNTGVHTADNQWKFRGSLTIDEKGTRAAAVTARFLHKWHPQARVAPSRSNSEDGIIFEANRPFLFFIRHNSTKTMMFSGALVFPYCNDACLSS